MTSATEYSNAHPSSIQPFRPHTATDVIVRPRLFGLLEHGASLTLVVAPAGYGKTTLIAGWLETCGLPSAWVTFDAEESNLHHFLTHVLTTLVACLPQYASNALQNLLAARTLPPLAVIAEILQQELATVEQEFVLVLDDFQAVTAPAAHALLTELLRLPPTPLRLIIATRHDPSLPLVRLRANGRLLEIRSRDLSFTAAETRQFLEDLLDAPLSVTEIDNLVRGTEGWVTSLRLAQLYLRQEQGFTSLARALEVGARHAREFLAEEVFAGLPPTIQTFLMQTAILERLSARVCAALSAADDVAATQANLQWLAANGVFTVPIDDTQEWFRCHALLRQFAVQQLRQHYDTAYVAMLHRRASRWFAAEAHTEEAIRHALAAGDLQEAVDILAEVRPALMITARWMEMAHLLHLFSAPQLESDAELLLAQAWFARSQNNLALLRASLQLATAQLAMPDAEPATGARHDRLTSLRGEVHVLWGHLCYWHADISNVVAYAVRAFAQVSPRAKFVRAFTALQCVIGYHALGERTAAHAILDEYARELNSEDGTDQLHWLTSMASLQFVEGDLSSLAAATDSMLQLSAGLSWTEPVGIAYYYRAVVHYCHNELTDVEPLAAEVLAHRYQLAPRYVVQAACTLALAYQAQGRVTDANAVAAAELTYVTINGITEMLPYLHGLQADLALRQGNITAAAAFLRESTQIPFTPTLYHYTPHLAFVRLYLHQNTPASLDAAEALLDRLQQFWNGIGNMPILLELQLLRALTWQARGQETAARTALAQVARLAEPAGNIRIFADCGREIDGLLANLQQMGVAPLLVAAARAAIAAETPNASRPAPSLSTPAVTENTVTENTVTENTVTENTVTDNLAVLLTFREQEVLRLLGEHLTNQEIAARLCISTETVKRHSISIFRKLDVNNRRAAALYARQLAPM